MVTDERPPDDWTSEDWQKLTQGEEIPTAKVMIELIDAKFVLAACHQWLPPEGMERIAVFQADDYKRFPVLVLITKMLDRLLRPPLASPPSEVSLTVGEISYILHFLHGNDSYMGGELFEQRLLTALQSLLQGGEK
ncbi:MAG: hypothetical protein ACE5I2_15220 [Anaerolineae bacterium]